MSKRVQSKTRAIPDFKSYEEEAAWWDTHDPLDYQDVSKPIIVVHPTAPKKTKTGILAIRLEDDMLTLIARDAQTKGMSAATLGRMIIYEYYQDRRQKQKG